MVTAVVNELDKAKKEEQSTKDFSKQTRCDFCKTLCLNSMLMVMWTHNTIVLQVDVLDKKKTNEQSALNPWLPAFNSNKTVGEQWQNMAGEPFLKRARVQAEHALKDMTKKVTTCSICHGRFFKNLDLEDNTNDVPLKADQDLHHTKPHWTYQDGPDAGQNFVTRNCGSVTKAYSRLATRTRETTVDTRMVVWCTEQKIARCTRTAILQQEGGPEALQFWDSMLAPLASLMMLWKSRAFRAAVDWINGVAPGMYFNYYCPGCHVSPMQARGWYLMNAIWDEEADNYTGLSKKRGCFFRCACCLMDFKSEYRQYRLLILTQAVWGRNYFFYFNADKDSGVTDAQVIANPGLYPHVLAGMMMDIMKGLVLCTYVVNKFGEVAVVSAEMLKDTMRNIMKDMEDQCRHELKDEYVFKFKADERVDEANYGNSGATYHSLKLGTKNSFAVEKKGEELVGLDMKLHYAEEQKKLGKIVSPRALDNERYVLMNKQYDPSDIISIEEMGKVIKTIPGKDALELVAKVCAPYNIGGVLMEAASKPWETLPNAEKNELKKLICFKQTVEEHGQQGFLDAVPREHWMSQKEFKARNAK